MTKVQKGGLFFWRPGLQVFKSFRKVIRVQELSKSNKGSRAFESNKDSRAFESNKDSRAFESLLIYNKY